MSTKHNITIRSVADELGVSVTTVSRSMNNLGKQYRIKDSTVRAVKKTADRLGYTPSNIAKSLRYQKTSTIGLMVPDIFNPWFANIASKIGKKSREMGYDVFLHDSGNDTPTEKKSLERLRDWMVDGIIMIPVGLESSHIVEATKKGTPIVLVDRFFENEEIPYVSTDDFNGAYQATKYMIENGHEKIACIQGLVGTSSNTQRVEGYKKALLDHGFLVKESFILGDDFSFENGYLQAINLASYLNETKITAIFSASNLITLGVLKAFKEKKVSIPGQVSIVSYDDQRYSELLYVPISTVSHSHQSLMLAQTALDILFKKTTKNVNILFPVTLVKRKSVRNMAV